jgi:DNA-binding MarR family transcriptional regulator
MRKEPTMKRLTLRLLALKRFARARRINNHDDVLVLLCLHGGEVTAGHLALAVGCMPAHLSRMLARLEQHKLIAREFGSPDRRQVRVGLTNRGRHMLDELEAALSAIEEAAA